MKKPDYSKASSEAMKILTDNFILEPPILAYELAENCGLGVFAVEFSDSSIAGMLDIEQKSILVNRDDSLTRQSFTIAHELGHWILHAKEGIIKEEILYRRPLESHDDNWMEKEANYFAAHLLVPASLLKSYKDLSQKDAAHVFRVSPSVIGYRRMNLNG